MIKKLIVVSALLIALFVPLSAQALERYEMLMLGDQDQYVLTLQKELYARGYLKAEPTGYFGTETQQALIRYQKQAGLTVDGKAGPTTLQKLYGKYYSPIPKSRVIVNDEPDDSPDALRLGDSGDAVKKVQQRLKELGYYEYDKITNYYGPMTEDAVRAFQQKNALKVDGVVGAKTYDTIFDDLAVRAEQPAAQTAAEADSGDGQAAADAAAAEDVQQSVGVAQAMEEAAQVSAADDKVALLLKFAKKQMGKRYRLGTAGPSTFDCSGFVYYCLHYLGIKASRSSGDQGYWDDWTKIAGQENLLPGDVVCFTSAGHPKGVGHTGLYLGDGKFIHSSTGKGVIISDLTTGEYLRRFQWGKRVPELYKKA